MTNKELYTDFITNVVLKNEINKNITLEIIDSISLNEQKSIISECIEYYVSTGDIKKSLNLKTIIDERFEDYKKINMYLFFPKCSFKCLRELNMPISICHNSEWAKKKTESYDIDCVINRFVDNKISDSIVFGGLEPIDSLCEILLLLYYLKKRHIVTDKIIYTGYNENELQFQLKILHLFENIILKFGRFIPNQERHFDEVLKVNLISPNQHAKRIS